MGLFGSGSPKALSRGTARTTGEFPLVQGAYAATGVSVPPNSLDRWFRARNNHAGQLVEVVIKGDSTWAGQVSGADTATDHYSPATRLRARLQGAGYTDGGHGWNNAVNDTPAVSGDPVSGVTARTGFATASDSFTLPGEVVTSTTLNDSVTFSGYGTHIRVFYRTYTIGGPFTYSVDGGSAVTVTPVNPVGNVANFDFIDVPGLTDGLHTVTVVNSGGNNVNVACDFVKTAGIVLHNQSIRGASSSNGVTPAQHLELQLGLTRSATQADASQQPLDTRPGVRRPSLFIWALGTNDQQGGGGTDTSANLKSNCILAGNAARAAGCDFLIAIPALDAASQPQLAATYRQALKDAATTLACPWVDLGLGGALPTVTAGSTNSNPHLTAAQYTTQADFLWDNLLGLT